MKKIQLSIVALLMLGAVACKKSDNSSILSGNVSNEEAADMIAGSLSLNSNGVANFSADAAIDVTTYTNLHLACGTTKSDSIARHSTTGSAYTYSYNVKYNYTLNCNTNNVPDNFSGNLSYTGSFSGPYLSSANTGSATFTIAGLSPSISYFLINGEYKRSGSFQSKVDTTNHGNASVDIVITNLKVTKPAHTISGGSATFSLTGVVPKKGNFSYTGTIVFNGDGTATLTLNSVIYTINLATGTKVKG